MAIIIAQFFMVIVPRNKGPIKTLIFPLKNVITFTTPSCYFKTLSPFCLINYFAQRFLFTLLPGDLTFYPLLHRAFPAPIRAALSA